MLVDVKFAGLAPTSRVLCLGIVLFVLYTAVYRLYFHPLAKYPGPFWARLSSFPAYWHTLRQDRNVWLWRLQEEYGHTFRYEPNNVLINTPTGYKTIFGAKGNVKKSLFYEAWPRTVNTLNTWNCTEISVHGPKRRVLNYVFSDKALRSAETFVLSNADRWCDLIHQTIPKKRGGEEEEEGEWSPSLNMADQVNYLVFDILGDLCFGKSFDMKEPNSTLRYVPHLMCEFVILLHPIAFSPFASLWVWLKPRGLDWLMAVAAPPAVKQWQTFVDGCLAERTKKEKELEEAAAAAAQSSSSSSSSSPFPEEKKNNNQQVQQQQQQQQDNVRKDFFHYLFHAIDPVTGKRGYELDELIGEAELLIIAGSDTTAIVMSAILFYLVRNLAIQDKLAREICSTFDDGDGENGFEEIKSGPKQLLTSCKYLRAVIQEALRMTPPVSAEPARVVRKGGTWVDGEFFPEGCNISTGFYCLSYSPELYYPDPFTFRPERWLVSSSSSSSSSSSDESTTTTTTEEDVTRAESGYCAFSTGSRGCPGKKLAWLEMSIVIAKLVYRFEMREDEQIKLGGGDPSNNGRPGRRNPDQYQTRDVFVSLRDGPMVRFREREKKKQH